LTKASNPPYCIRVVIVERWRLAIAGDPGSDPTRLTDEELVHGVARIEVPFASVR